MIERPGSLGTPGSLDTPAFQFCKNQVIVKKKYLTKSEKESRKQREEDGDTTELKPSYVGRCFEVFYILFDRKMY